MSSGVQIECQGLDNLLDRLDDDDYRKDIIFKALKEGAKVLQLQAQENFRKEVKGATHHSKYINKPFFEGVKLITDKAYSDVIVSIMSDFRMKFFEKGTFKASGQPRMTKGRRVKGADGNYIKRATKGTRYLRSGKGHSTGSIKATNFFRNARQQQEDNISWTITDSISIALKKL